MSNRIYWLNPEGIQERRNQFSGVNSTKCRGDEILFRHPTRQLTSSAKAREVIRPPDSGGFFVFIKQKGSLMLQVGLFIMPILRKGIWKAERKESDKACWALSRPMLFFLHF
jgi:hypothetical protein